MCCHFCVHALQWRTATCTSDAQGYPITVVKTKGTEVGISIPILSTEPLLTSAVLQNYLGAACHLGQDTKHEERSMGRRKSKLNVFQPRFLGKISTVDTVNSVDFNQDELGKFQITF